MADRSFAIRWGFRAGVLLSLTLFAGRLTGLFRELALASVFGVSTDADIAVLLLTLPDLLVNLLLAGGLSAALVPRFATLPAQQAMDLLRQLSIVVLLIFGTAGVIFVVSPQSVFTLLAPGVVLPPEMRILTLVTVAAAVPLSGLSGICGAYLNANHRFFMTGAGTLIFNICILGSLYASSLSNSKELLIYLGTGIALGASLRWVSQLCQIPAHTWLRQSDALLIDKSLVKSFVAATTATALMLLAPLMMRALASTLGPGAVASFNYAQKLLELPLGILITSISTIALPQLSGFEANNKRIEAHACMTKHTQNALMIALAVTIPSVCFADSIVHTVFSRGEMGAFALLRVSDLSRIAFLSIPAIAISSMAIAGLNAADKSQSVLKVMLGSLLVLPLLSLPGLLFSSEQELMAAAVAFQILVAAWVARLSKLRFWGATGLINATTWPYYGIILCSGVLTAVLSFILALENHWLRLFVASIGFAISLLAIRRFRQSDVLSIDTPPIR